MKKILSIFLFSIIIFGSLHAQDQNQDDPSLYKRQFIGFSTGINNISGVIGMHGNFALSNKVMLGVGAGLGMWGFKTGVNLQYHPKGFYSYYFKSGVSLAAGMKGLELDMATEHHGVQEVDIDLKQVYNFNVIFGYNFKLGKKSRFFVESGFAVNLTQNAYELQEDIEITSESEEVMDRMTPGGLRLAIGFDF